MGLFDQFYTFWRFRHQRPPLSRRGGTTEKVLACTGGLVVYNDGSGGQRRRMRRPQVSLGRACGLIWPILHFLTLQAPTAAAIAAGGTTEEVLACTGGLVVYIVDYSGHGRGLRRPQVSCSCFMARLLAYLANFTLFGASGTNGRRYRGGRHH